MHRSFRLPASAAPGTQHRPDASASARVFPVTRFTNCRLLRDHQLRLEDLWICKGVIIDPQVLFWEGRTADSTVDCQGCIIAPGYIDLQLNGAFGVDFCTPGPELAAGLRRVAQRLPEHGVSAFLPTVITSSRNTYEQILPQLVPTSGSADSGAAVLGVHLEGPFISPGKPGYHPQQHIITPDGQSGALQRACGAHTAHVRIVTLAPERPNAMHLIGELVAQGIVVSAGHSMVSAAEMEAAQAAGVRKCTHLFNAMPAFEPREPGIIGVLGSATLPRPFFGLIADGIHVHPASLKLAATVRPDSVVLVTDGIVALGLPEGTYNFADVGEIHVTAGGRALKAGSSTLAGAVVPMDECVRRFCRFTECGVVRALEAATLHPAQVLGIAHRKGTLDPGADADILFLDDELHVLRCYLAGEAAWPKPKA